MSRVFKILVLGFGCTVCLSAVSTEGAGAVSHGPLSTGVYASYEQRTITQFGMFTWVDTDINTAILGATVGYYLDRRLMHQIGLDVALTRTETDMNNATSLNSILTTESFYRFNIPIGRVVALFTGGGAGFAVTDTETKAGGAGDFSRTTEDWHAHVVPIGVKVFISERASIDVTTKALFQLGEDSEWDTGFSVTLGLTGYVL